MLILCSMLKHECNVKHTIFLARKLAWNVL